MTFSDPYTLQGIADRAPRNPKRILLYTRSFSPAIGGMEALIELLANAFHSMGKRVTVATHSVGALSPSFAFPVVRRPSSFALLRLGRAHDIIFTAPLTLRCLLPLILAARPIIAIHPNPFTGRDGLVRPVDHLKLAISRRMRNIVPSKYLGMKIPHAHIIPNPYDAERFQNEAQGSRVGVLYVGRLTPVKGVDVLLRAIEITRKRGRHIPVTIVGDGPDRSRLEELAQTLNLSDLITFAGVRTGLDLARTMREHQVLVIPSTYREPFGIVALEGLASGCTVIVSREGGLVEAVGSHALFFQNGDANELAECILRALDDEPLRGRLRVGLTDHLQQYHPMTVAEAYLSFICGKA